MLDRKDRAALRQVGIWVLIALFGCLGILGMTAVLGIAVHEFRLLAGV